MGILRLLLALSVVLSHAAPAGNFSMLGGPFAVKMFYIISGFYMALILNEKYTGSLRRPYYTFITNRVIRIYPAYWLVLGCTLAVSVAFMYAAGGTEAGMLKPWIRHWHELHPSTIAVLSLVQLALFGQDILLFTGIDLATGMMYFTDNFRNSIPSSPSFMAIPQAWTISIELMFYVIAPFILRRRTFVIALLWMAALALNIALRGAGFDYDPWTYRFFPAEMLFFLSGALAYRIWKHHAQRYITSSVGLTAFAAVFIFTLLYAWIPGNAKMFVYMVLFVAALPAIFQLTKDLEWDRHVGELSYPVYLCHILVIFLANQAHVRPGVHFIVTVVAGSIFFSLIMNELALKPIERFRQKRVVRQSRAL